MNSSSFVSTRLVLVSILAIMAIQLPFIHSVFINQTNAYLHHKCIKSQGSYKLGSPYEDNLSRVIRLMSTSITNYGFVHASKGDTPNTVFAKFQCRGDFDITVCRSCLTIAFSKLLKSCPENKGKIIWYDDCLLEISPTDTLFKLDYQNHFYMNSEKDVPRDLKLFNKNTKDLLYKLKEKAISKENNYKKIQFLYATGEKNLGTKKLYAMVQCTKDLSAKNCDVCLNSIMAKLPKCCNDKQGGRVLSTSCNFRYELYPFINT